MSEFSMELDDVDLESLAKVELTHPVTGETIVCKDGIPFHVMVRSAASQIVERRLHEVQRKWKRLAEKNPAPNRGQMTFDQTRGYKADVYAVAVADWRIGKGPGSPVMDVPCTRENASKWCLANLTLFAPQISRGCDSLEAYVKDAGGNDSPTTSAPSTARSEPAAD